jgi:hypothetical protein
MTAPNLASPKSIVGKMAPQAVGTGATAIVSNAAASNTLVKVSTLYVGNIDTGAPYKITVDLFRASTAYNILYQVSIPAGAGLDVLSKAINLEEGDSLRLTADTASKLQAVASYEVIS